MSRLQSELQPSGSLLGPITLDLLQQLSQAALFQKLCSGDLQAVPGLMTSSRLTCLMQLLQDEALPTQPEGSSANAPEIKPELAEGGGVSVDSPAAVPDTSPASGFDATPEGEAGSGSGVDSSASLPDGRLGIAKSVGTDQMNGSSAKGGQESERELHARRALVFVSEDTTADR